VQLNKIKTLQAQVDMDNLVIETEKLDRVVKSVIDIEKKLKNNEHEDAVKNFQNKYESLKKKYVEMLKIMDKNQLVKVESYFPYFLEAAKDLYRVKLSKYPFKNEANQIIFSFSNPSCSSPTKNQRQTRRKSSSTSLKSSPTRFQSSQTPSSQRQKTTSP
jgi:hypothetical protein